MKYILLVIVTIILTGCGVGTVYNVENKIFQKRLDNRSMESIIIDSGKSLGWTMKKIDNKDIIIATLLKRNHSATIKIEYTNNSYKIHFVSAKNLKYDKANNTIHNNYNGWIGNLENQIDSRLKPLEMNSTLIEEEKKAMLDSKNNTNLESMGKLEKIYNVTQAQIKAKSTNLSEIGDKIIKAGRDNGWIMAKQKNGFILARMVQRVHTAIVRIDYTTTEYNITYITSDKLSYKDYSIHKNYNIWIKNLELAINIELLAIK